MTAPFLGESLGPRAQRRTALASVAAGVLLAAAVAVALQRLHGRGQLDPTLWRPLVRADILRFLAGGLSSTLKAAGAAGVLALLVGALAAFGRLAKGRLLRWAAGAYVEFFRAVPLLLMIFFSVLGLPELGLRLPSFWFLVLPLAAYNSAVLGEIFRAGILSLERGQSEAAYALGLGYWPTMLLVVIPQAVRRMVPAVVSQLVTLLKDTSLGLVVPYEELLRRAQLTGQKFHNDLPAYATVAVVYLVVNALLSQLARRLEVRQRRRYRAGEIKVTGADDLAVVSAHGTGAVR